MISAIIFIAITFIGFILALWRGPFWGLLAYANIYFNAPDPEINWWASYIPDFRWSLLCSAVLMISLVIHRDKLSKHKFHSTLWMYMFFILTLFITYTSAIHPDAKTNTYMLFTFCVTVFFIIKSLSKFEQLRGYSLTIIGLSTYLSFRAHTEGKRVHARLENIGPADAFSSNEFGVLLASIIPFILPFLVRGKWYERAICILAIPFLLNAFVLCNSRGAFVSFAFGILYSFLFIADKKIKKFLLIAGMLAIPIFLYFADIYFIERISSLWRSELNTEESLNELSSGRTAIWKYGLTMAKDHPLGVGPNGFRELSRFYMPEEMLTVHPGAMYGVRAAHNSYLQVLVEQGFLGLVIFLVMCFYTMYLLYVSAQKSKKLNPAGNFIDLYIVSLNMSFACSMMGGMVGSQVYYEFMWWQIAFASVTYSFVIEMEKGAADPIK